MLHVLTLCIFLLWEEFVQLLDGWMQNYHLAVICVRQIEIFVPSYGEFHWSPPVHLKHLSVFQGAGKNVIIVATN